MSMEVKTNMVSLGKKIWNSITGKKKTRERILRDISEDSLKSDKEKNAQAKYIQALETQVSKFSAEKRHKQVDEINTQDDLDLIEKLKEEQKRLEKEKYMNSYDLMLLFRKLIKNKNNFANKLEISDKNDVHIFDKFKTIRILKNGYLAIQGRSGEIWAEGPRIEHIIHKPESLKNQIRRGRILIPYNEDLRFVPDLENYEMEEMSYNPEAENESERWNISEERFKKVKEMIMERDELINQLREDKEKNEQTIADLRRKNQDLKLSMKSWQTQAETNQSNLSAALDHEKQMSQRLLSVDRDLAIAQEQKKLTEEENKALETAYGSVVEELEDDKSKSERRKAKDEVHTDLAMAKKLVPEQIIKTIENEQEIEKEVIRAKPGEKLR